MPMTPEQVTNLMESSQTAAEWEANAKAVKKDNGGSYPFFWWRCTQENGLAERVFQRWGGTGLKVVDPKEIGL